MLSQAGRLEGFYALCPVARRPFKIVFSSYLHPACRKGVMLPQIGTVRSGVLSFSRADHPSVSKKKSSFIPRNSTPCYGLDCRVEFPGALCPWSLSPPSWFHKPALLLSSANRLQVGDQQSAPCRGGVRGGQTPHQAAGGIWFPRDVGLLAGGGQLMKAETKTQ